MPTIALFSVSRISLSVHGKQKKKGKNNGNITLSSNLLKFESCSTGHLEHFIVKHPMHVPIKILLKRKGMIEEEIASFPSFPPLYLLHYFPDFFLFSSKSLIFI